MPTSIRRLGARSLRHRVVGSAWRRRERSRRIVTMTSTPSTRWTDSTTTAHGRDRANGRPRERSSAHATRNSGGLLPYVSTAPTVDDMDAIRAAMGVPTISYVGFSYGTYLGAVYADRYPNARARDGARRCSRSAQSYADGTIRPGRRLRRRPRRVPRLVRTTRTATSRATATRTRRSTDLTLSPRARDIPRRPCTARQRTLGPGEANIGVATALYAGRTGGRRSLHALSEPAQGDGSGCSRSRTRTPAAGPAATTTTRPTRSTRSVASTRPRRRRSPRFSDSPNAPNGPRRTSGRRPCGSVLPCTFWPAPSDRKVGPIRAPRARRRSSSSGRPTIPRRRTRGRRPSPELSSSRRLLTYVGEGHTAYGRGDSCVDAKVDRYLTAGVLPGAADRCG